MSTARPTRVLQAAAEIYPLVKTGGLGDVIGALPAALARAGLDVRLLLPGYPAVLDAFQASRRVAVLGPAFGAAGITVRVGRLQGIDLRAYVIDAPYLYARAGHPYLGPDGHDWPDNALRFAALGWVAARIGAGLDRNWRPQIVHGHDWHAALACAYLALEPAACRSVFTIHNLAFQGLFAPDLMPALQLPVHLFTIDGIEFFGRASAMKAGIQYADRITTVSPTYAREIRTREFGCGLEGVLDRRASHLRGILNGVDGAVWNPARDVHLARHYDATRLADKRAVKSALQSELGLHAAPDAPVIGVVSRLTQQKGIDLLLQAAPDLVAAGAQITVLGSGDTAIEEALRALAEAQRGGIAARFGYDEPLAHRIIAGADLIAVPSRFEPCGLTQLYGLRYGTLPLVRRVGGLADTVVDADADALSADRATGFVFNAATVDALRAAARRALALYRDRDHWQQVQRRAMAQDFSWDAAAAHYLDLYRELAPGAEALAVEA
jgi:starch synthase